MMSFTTACGRLKLGPFLFARNLLVLWDTLACDENEGCEEGIEADMLCSFDGVVGDLVCISLIVLAIDRRSSKCVDGLFSVDQKW